MLGVGTGDLGFASPDGPPDMVLNIGPQHPSTHGVLRLKLVLDGERIVSAEPIIGYMHRGAEKLFEVRDYRQIIVLANRHDWLSAFSNELGVVLAVERMLGMEVPMRAVWTRTLLAELNRVLNHLMFLGSYPLELGAITPDLLRVPRARGDPGASWRRSPAAGCTTCSTGSAASRRTSRPAGPAARAAPSPRSARRLPRSRRPGPRQRDLPRPHASGSACSTREQVQQYGVCGPDRPRLRASTSTCAATSRTSRTASCSDVLRVVTRDRGRLLRPLRVLLEQAYVSLDLADACLDRLADAAARADQPRGCPRC